MLLVHSSARVPRSAYRKVDRGSQQPAGINYYQLTTHVLPTTFSRKLIRLRNILTRPSIATAGRLVHSVYRDNPCRGVTSGPWNKRCRPGLSEVAAAEAGHLCTTDADTSSARHMLYPTQHLSCVQNVLSDRHKNSYRWYRVGVTERDLTHVIWANCVESLAGPVDINSTRLKEVQHSLT